MDVPTLRVSKNDKQEGGGRTVNREDKMTLSSVLERSVI